MRVFIKGILLAAFVTSAIAVTAQENSDHQKKRGIDPIREVKTSTVVEPASNTGEEDNVLSTSETMTFDTSSVPEDSLTILIRELFRVNNLKQTFPDETRSAMESMGSVFSEDQAEMYEQFMKRFMYELEYGDARRWVDNMFVRNFRKLFTKEEIQYLITVSESPHGRTVLEKLKLLSRNVENDGKKIGKYLGERIALELFQETEKK